MDASSTTSVKIFAEIDLSDLCCAKHVHLLRAEKSIGTLGGGNHFIEVDRDEEGNLYVVVHSGSRHLGKEVAASPAGLTVQSAARSSYRGYTGQIVVLRHMPAVSECWSVLNFLSVSAHSDLHWERQ